MQAKKESLAPNPVPVSLCRPQTSYVLGGYQVQSYLWFWLPPGSRQELRSSGLLRSELW